MRKPFLFVVLALLSLSPGEAAERLKAKKGAEDLETFQRSRPARLVEWDYPQYPAEPGADWGQQAVRVAFDITVEGKVEGARALPGPEKFQAAAVAAVSKWRFEPQSFDGKPKPVSKEVRVVFTPKGTPKKSKQDETWPPFLIEHAATVPPGDPPGNEAIYPKFLVDRQLSGEVELMLGLDDKGRVEGVSVIRATHPDFLGGALETVAGWELRPARQGRTPVSAQTRAVLTFFPVDKEGRLTRAEWLERNGIVLQHGSEAGTTSQFDRTPVAVVMVDPVYPRELLLAGTRGAARVNFSVNLNGGIVAVNVAEATAPEFGAAVAAAIAAWHFEPLQRGGGDSGADFSMTWKFKEPDPASAERRLLDSLGTEKRPVGARELDRPLHPLFVRDAVYPVALREAREEGEASIEVTIDRDGRVRLPHIRSASRPEFGWAAATAVSQWLFETPRKGGEPVDVQVVIPLKFKVPAQEP